MKTPMLTAKTVFACLSRFFHRLGADRPEEWDRMYLCSMAPMSAGALRHNEEAEHIHDY